MEMIHIFIEKYAHKFLSRWIILASDVVLVFCLFYVATILSLNFQVEQNFLDKLHINALIIALFYGSFFSLTGSYKSIIRQTSLKDLYLLFKASTFSLVFLVSAKFVLEKINFNIFSATTLTMLLLHYLLVLFFLIGFRSLIKSIFFLVNSQVNKSNTKVNVLIYGSGSAGIITRESLAKETSTWYRVVAFIDDNPTKQGKLLDGIRILKKEHALSEKFISKHAVNQLIIAVHKIDSATRKEIIQHSVDLGLQVKVVPPVRAWIQGELTSKQIKSVKIEDLLERETIELDSLNLKLALTNKVILVTGAAGSIGSEITRQLLSYNPKKVIAIDRAESALYDLEMELLNADKKRHDSTIFLVSDVCNRPRMARVFEEWKPDLVFHTAAYKHVPLMEAQPFEAIQVNVLGTRIIADLSLQYNVEKFVLVSTDKAVNPTNVMGASKRLAEMYIQDANQIAKTQFITTRFGNVLGSNGSVVPLFKKQIEKGGPITITHPEITRYFMTIPEACNLVLEAGAMGAGGEIFVFDMGQPIKIIDLAKNMIRLSGLKLGEDIDIQFTGLRPGEKLYEELLACNEQTKPTHHEKILIGDTRPVDSKMLQETIAFLETAISTIHEDVVLVRKLKQIIPEFKSQNSKYASLDTNVHPIDAH
jgi:FlaA1/EpsC-like NDP-sugar epimerase